MRRLSLLCVVALAGAVAGQEPPSGGVLLPRKEYDALREQAEAAKGKEKEPKPAAPSACHVRGRVEVKGGRPVAVLTLTFHYRTTTSRAVVALGCQRAFPAAAKAGADPAKLPVLTATDDGLTVLVERPGDHTLTLDLEAPVGPRGGKGEVGFEVGLPRAAITTFALEPVAGAKAATVSVRTADGKRSTEDAARFAPPATGNGPPVGAAESLEVTWDAPAAGPAADTPSTVEAEVAVRVEEGFVETVAKLRLRGPARDWPLVLPPLAEVTIEKTGAAATDRGATITRPADPKHPDWAVRTPDAGEWVVTATVRRPRTEPKTPAVIPVGPFFAANVPRQAGVVRVFAPPAVKLSAAAPPEVRPQDAPPPAAGEDAPALLFRYAAAPLKDGKPVPLADLDVRPARGAVQVSPAYKLRLTEAGWRLRAEAKVTPVRTDPDRLTIDVPAGWQAVDVLPPGLVDEVIPGPNGRLTVKFAERQRAAFDLVLEATWPTTPTTREATIPLPRFAQAAERGATVTAAVPDGFAVRGTAREGDAKGPPGFPAELTPAAPGPGGAVTSASGRFDAGVGSVDLRWGPHQPEISADVAAEVTLYDRQAEVAETIKLSAADGLPRRVRLTGPPLPAGFRSQPPLDPAGPGEWTFAPPAGAAEATLTVRYAVPAAAGKVPVPLVWPDAARVESGVRVWAAAGVRPARFDGPWRERPPEPDRARDALPALTLAGAGGGLSLTLELAPAADGGAVTIDRGAVQAWAADDGGVHVRGRYVLRRWPAGGVDVEVPAGAAVSVFADRKQVEPIPLGEAGDARVLRVPLPEWRAARPATELDVRFVTPARAGGSLFGVPPPVVRGAAVRGPVRWQLAVPASAVVVVPDPAFLPDGKWQWRGWGFAPAPAGTPADLDAWLAAGTEADADADAPGWGSAGGEVIGGRLPPGAGLRAVRVPRAAWVLGCSAVVVAVGWLLARLRPRPLGLLAAVVGVAVAGLAVWLPQAAGQAAAGAQPGAVLLVVGLAVAGVRRWRRARAAAPPPTFARTPAAGSGKSSIPAAV